MKHCRPYNSSRGQLPDFTLEVFVQNLSRLIWICGGQMDSGAVLPPSPSLLTCQHHPTLIKSSFTDAMYSL